MRRAYKRGTPCRDGRTGAHGTAHGTMIHTTAASDPNGAVAAADDDDTFAARAVTVTTRGKVWVVKNVQRRIAINAGIILNCNVEIVTD